MKRTIIFFSLTILVGLIVIILFPYYSINPGVLVKGHSNLRNNCFACHSIGSGATTNKCIACHNIASIGLVNVAGLTITKSNNKTNLLHKSIKDIRCFYCHTEHNGLSRENATLNFTHSVLPKLMLNNCTDCHIDKKPGDDLHKKVNIDCSSCHNTNDWKIGKFNHKLLGALEINCINCHLTQKPNDGIHRNLSADIQCSQCHTSSEWKPSTFDHNKFFRFDENHPSDCKNCHNIQSDYKSYTCYNCHEHQPSRISEKHLEEGIRDFNNCAKCHRSGNEDEVKNEHNEGHDDD
jgi:hypothetical protein